MTRRSPVLALVRPAPALGDAVRTALAEVWTGEVRELDAGASSAALCVYAAPTITELMAELERDRSRSPVLGVVVHGARRARTGTLQPPLAWVASADELDARSLGMAIRFTLEVGSRWRLAEQVQSLQPLADLGLSATVVSHELNNVLTSLILDAELARSRAAVAAREHPRLAELEQVTTELLDSARQVGRVARDLSRVSRPAGRTTVADPVELAESARRLCGDVLRNVAFEIAVVRPVDLRTDERRLTQVLVNLIRNAAQALGTRPGGRIRVEIDHADGRAVLRVIDNGPGLPKWVAERLFEPWTTTKATGTGLGLALARRYLAEMGGTIDLVPGDGATFELRLPKGDFVRPTLVPDFKVGGARVLVVDDAEVVRRSLMRTLAPLGSVDTATDVATALSLTSRNRYDVLIVDMNLPDGSGRAVWDLVDPWSRERMVFLSGDYTPEEQTWLDERKVPWALKPIGTDEVRQLVARLAERS